MAKRIRVLSVLVPLAVLALVAAGVVPAGAVPGGAAPAGAASRDHRVNVDSPPGRFAQNKQNEPALAVNANHPNILVAGANDQIDQEACNAGPDNDCPFTPGVGVSGVYFSFNRGASWTQPTYPGWSGRKCLGKPGNNDPVCHPGTGPIGTVPKYGGSGLVSDGDPALAFGPQPGKNGAFSWANGARLYYASLTSNFPGKSTFQGQEAVAVSRTDNVVAAAAGKKSAWMAPVLASRQTSSTFSDKDQVWADNAASSKFFGNVYVCVGDFEGTGAASTLSLEVARSTDGGTTWQQSTVIKPVNINTNPGFSGCTVRTDSHGVVYVFAVKFGLGTPGHGSHVMVKSLDGGRTWTKPRSIGRVVDTCFVTQFDGNAPRCVEDGMAGARDDLSSAPSVDIANGAPSGKDATNELLRSWVDGRAGLAHPQVMVSHSTSAGKKWSPAQVVKAGTDRGYYSAIAASPDGTDAYLVYNAFTTPYRHDTTSTRGLVGVVKHANLGAKGLFGQWTTLHRGQVGDPRASAQNNLWLEFLGDYVYAVGTRTYGGAVWNDMRNGANCPAVDGWRAKAQQAAKNGTAPPTPPAPQQVCPANYGNSDIYGGGFIDPTP